MTQKDREDKLNAALKNPTMRINQSNEISQLIDNTIRNKHKVFCTTDWHLFVRIKKGFSDCKERDNFSKIINNMHSITNNDVIINFGDLVDGECTHDADKNRLRNIISRMPGHKILILGNNDLFFRNFYKSCGFEYVVESFIWHNILFTHMPNKNHKYDMNIHGHIHGSKQYWVPYNKHIDVAYCGGREMPVDLKKVMNTQPSYAKIIKVSPEHFNESCGLFDSIMTNGNRIEDPFHD